jgi:hypothetical protein
MHAKTFSVETSYAVKDAQDSIRGAMEKLQEKAKSYLNRMEESDFWPDSLNYKKAICFICLGEYRKAQAHFVSCLKGLRTTFKLWAMSNQPDLLVNVWLLSGNLDMLSKIRADLDSYLASQREVNYLGDFSLLLLKMVARQDRATSPFIAKLLANPSLKDGYEIGTIAQSVVNRDQDRLNLSLQNLLDIHNKSAKYGSLRETPEGLICLNAMSLAHCAIQRNLDIQYNGYYLPIDYLEFLYG